MSVLYAFFFNSIFGEVLSNKDRFKAFTTLTLNKYNVVFYSFCFVSFSFFFFFKIHRVLLKAIYVHGTKEPEIILTGPEIRAVLLLLELGHPLATMELVSVLYLLCQ